MHIGRNNPKAEYFMNGEKLSESDSERDIGVTISNNLKPSKQCSEAARKPNAVLGMITKAFHYRDRYVFINLYKQYVRPHLEFCSPAWSPWTQADINCLENIQQRAVRLVSGLRSQDYKDRLQELKLLSLKDRRIKTDMITTYKILNGFDRVDSSTWFKQINQTRRTRLNADPANLESSFSKTEIRRNFFNIRLPDIWNKLPANVKVQPLSICSSPDMMIIYAQELLMLSKSSLSEFLINSSLPGRNSHNGPTGTAENHHRSKK